MNLTLRQTRNFMQRSTHKISYLRKQRSFKVFYIAATSKKMINRHTDALKLPDERFRLTR